LPLHNEADLYRLVQNRAITSSSTPETCFQPRHHVLEWRKFFSFSYPTSSSYSTTNTNIDKGTFYGPPDNNSLQILATYFKLYPEDAPSITISLKACLSFPSHIPDCSPSAIRSAVDNALSILPPSLKKIDIFELARIDPEVDLEESMKTLKELVEKGKIGGVGLSEVKASTIRKAHAICKLSMVENGLSLFSRDDLGNGVLETCKERKSSLHVYFSIKRVHQREVRNNTDET
jgi:aryl-alcohol dehydrogenase-like predicted oxidoreductase